MKSFEQYSIWFVTGSQHLYGEETLQQVADNVHTIVNYLNDCGKISVKIVFKPVQTTPDSIFQLILDANSSRDCIGLITWMHTFSPAKMWINGLKTLIKPFVHLHTQFNRDIPWADINMDFMNLNQSAHGGREFGFINARMRIDRKVVVGHWQDEEVIEKLNIWSRVAIAWAESQTMKIARLGDNMREVAVTEGNKVSAQYTFGYSVNGYGMGDLVAFIDQVEDRAIEILCEQYGDEYVLARVLQKGNAQHESLREAARIEIGLRTFLKNGGFSAFTDTFENLHGLRQLPGLAVQRLMAEGYGFGAEGDWKTAALVRSMKIMGQNLSGGNSFMEDYTYHFHPEKMSVLGAHMLEICPSIAKGKPNCEIHPLGIGGKEDPVRLVFNVEKGSALNASIIDMGDRFRLLVNTVNAIEPEEDLPNLPVARVLWQPHPNLKDGAAAWILAGGAHHTCYSQSLTTEYLEDFAEMAGIEFVLIDENTQLHSFKQSLRWNDMYYRLAGR